MHAQMSKSLRLYAREDEAVRRELERTTVADVLSDGQVHTRPRKPDPHPRTATC